MSLPFIYEALAAIFIIWGIPTFLLSLNLKLSFGILLLWALRLALDYCCIHCEYVILRLDVEGEVMRVNLVDDQSLIIVLHAHSSLVLKFLLSLIVFLRPHTTEQVIFLEVFVPGSLSLRSDWVSQVLVINSHCDIERFSHNVHCWSWPFEYLHLITASSWMRRWWVTDLYIRN
jgi:hypothetical protein